MPTVVVMLGKTSLRLIKTTGCSWIGFPTSSITSVGATSALNEQQLFSWHGQVASRDTTVPDPTWHGISRRGAVTDFPAFTAGVLN